MDSNGRIKIGDFGLATSQTVKQGGSSIPVTESIHSHDGTTSGKVGTALYVAPELCTSRTRGKVSPKVDMYSLGIILFEMFYRPLGTKMERIKILGLLRTVRLFYQYYFCWHHPSFVKVYSAKFSGNSNLLKSKTEILL